MDFDLLLLGAYPPDQLLDLAHLAEDRGYRCLWYADEKFYRDPYVSLTFLGLGLRKLDLGVCVTDPYTRHPAISAMAAATLAELLPGRFSLGIGAGFSGLSSLGVQQEKPVLALRESIQLMRRLWSGERVDFRGQVVNFRDGRLEFTPPEKHVPIVLAATGRKVLELAGEISDGIIIGECASAFTLGKAMEHIRVGAQRAGRSLGKIPIAARVDVTIGSDTSAAIGFGKPRIIVWALWFTYPKWDYWLDYSPEWEERLAPLKQFIEKRGAKPRDASDYDLVAPYTHLVTDEMVQHRHLAGTVDDIVKQICSLAPIGVNRIIVHPSPMQDQTETWVIEKFASQVIPSVRALLG